MYACINDREKGKKRRGEERREERKKIIIQRNSHPFKVKMNEYI